MGRAFRRHLRGLCASAVSFQNGMHKFNGNTIPVTDTARGIFNMKHSDSMIAFKLIVILTVTFAFSQCTTKSTPSAQSYTTWQSYGGGPEDNHYSALDQINRSNVGQLKVAWKYDTGDAFKDSEMECNPIIIHGVLYATSPKLRVFALNAATGQQIWSFSPPGEGPVLHAMHYRGLTYWSDGSEARLFFSSGHDLYALNAKTGKPVPSFGESRAH